MKELKPSKKAYLSPCLDSFNGDVRVYWFQQKPTFDCVLITLKTAIKKVRRTTFEQPSIPIKGGIIKINNVSDNWRKQSNTRVCQEKAIVWTMH